MTTYATLPPDLADRPTAPFEVPQPSDQLDPLELIDDGSRSRIIPSTFARSGPHLDLGQRQVLRLDRRITHIGRGLTADLRLEDPRISRSHAIAVRHGRFTRLLDNRSSTGTFVNGRRVLATTLRDGDEITLGPVTMRYLEID